MYCLKTRVPRVLRSTFVHSRAVVSHLTPSPRGTRETCEYRAERHDCSGVPLILIPQPESGRVGLHCTAYPDTRVLIHRRSAGEEVFVLPGPGRAGPGPGYRI